MKDKGINICKACSTEEKKKGDTSLGLSGIVRRYSLSKWFIFLLKYNNHRYYQLHVRY